MIRQQIFIVEKCLKQPEGRKIKLLSTVFLQECKYIEKEKKVIRYITNDLIFSSDDSDESDEE